MRVLRRCRPLIAAAAAAVTAVALAPVAGRAQALPPVPTATTQTPSSGVLGTPDALAQAVIPDPNARLLAPNTSQRRLRRPGDQTQDQAPAADTHRAVAHRRDAGLRQSARLRRRQYRLRLDEPAEEQKEEAAGASAAAAGSGRDDTSARDHLRSAGDDPIHHAAANPADTGTNPAADARGLSVEGRQPAGRAAAGALPAAADRQRAARGPSARRGEPAGRHLAGGAAARRRRRRPSGGEHADPGHGAAQHLSARHADAAAVAGRRHRSVCADRSARRLVHFPSRGRIVDRLLDQPASHTGRPRLALFHRRAGAAGAIRLVASFADRQHRRQLHRLHQQQLCAVAQPAVSEFQDRRPYRRDARNPDRSGEPRHRLDRQSRQPQHCGRPRQAADRHHGRRHCRCGAEFQSFDSVVERHHSTAPNIRIRP